MQHIDEKARALPASELQARMLHVSRLATIGEMAAGVAHELNQPLTAIANYAQACERLLARPRIELEDCRMALSEITTQAVRASDIMRRLQTLARSQAMNRESMDLESLITPIMGLVHGDARSHGISCSLRRRAPMPSSPSSFSRVRQSLRSPIQAWDIPVQRSPRTGSPSWPRSSPAAPSST